MCKSFEIVHIEKNIASDEPQKKAYLIFQMSQIKNHVFAHEKNVPRTKKRNFTPYPHDRVTDRKPPPPHKILEKNRDTQKF